MRSLVFVVLCSSLFGSPGLASPTAATVFGQDVVVDTSTLNDSADPARVMLASTGLPTYVSFRGSANGGDEASSVDIDYLSAQDSLQTFLDTHFAAYGMSNPLDHGDLATVYFSPTSNPTDPEFHLPAETIVWWEQSFLGVPIKSGELIATFFSRELWSLSGSVYSAEVLERKFGEAIRGNSMVAAAVASNAMDIYARDELDISNAAVPTPSLVLDPIGGALAWVAQIDDWEFLVDAMNGKIYHVTRMRAEYGPWTADYTISFRILEKTAGQRYFYRSINSQLMQTDGQADYRTYLVNSCQYRSTVGASENSPLYVSDFPYPSTYKYGTGDAIGGFYTCSWSSGGSSFTATSGYNLWVQNTHYRIARSAHSAMNDTLGNGLYLYLTYSPVQTLPLQTYLSYYDGLAGGGISLMGGWDKIEIGVTCTVPPEHVVPDPRECSGNEGRFQPLHEYGHYTHHMYGFWPPGGEVRLGAAEGIADALALSFAERLHNEVPTNATFLDPCTEPGECAGGNRACWFSPHSAAEYHNVYAYCPNRWACGLPVPELMYKFLHNRVCSSWTPSCVPSEIAQYDRVNYVKYELAGRIGRQALSHAMLTVSRNDPSAAEVLTNMLDWIVFNWWVEVLTPSEKVMVELAFSQHGVTL
jgi:hypothetical protein